MDHKIYQGVSLAPGVQVEEYCIIGKPFVDMKEDESSTIVGQDSIIRSHTIIYAGNKIGRCFQTGHGAFLRELNSIGNNVAIGTKTIIEHHVTIEDEVRIHSQAFVAEYSVLKKGCWLGPNVVLTNAKYPRSPNVKKELRGVLLKEEAKIGANATILPGVVIGKGALVGAGSVVTKDVPDYTVVAGNPAVIINTIKNLPYRN